MTESLGIFVNTKDHIKHLLGLVKAAEKRGVAVKMFITHTGVLMARDPLFDELASMAETVLCRVNFEAHGLDQDEGIFGREHFTLSNQAGHAELVFDCDRYITL